MIGKTNAISGVSAPAPRIKTVSGSVISISDALALPAESLVVGIEPVQSGSGDPSPSNVRPISGWSAVNVYREAQYDAGATPYVTINLNGTVYGGSLNVTTGVMTVTHQTVDLGLLSWIRRSNPRGDLSSTYLFSASPSYYGQAKSSFVGMLSSYKWVTNYNNFTEDYTAGYIYGTQIAIRDDRYTDEIAFKSAVAGQQCCYELATPQTVQLTPTQVQMLLGNNTLWADSGDSELQYWARR